MLCMWDWEGKSHVKICLHVLFLWWSTETVLVPCELVALFLWCSRRGFDLTWNGHALCSAVNTQTIRTAGFLQMLELQSNLRDFPSLPWGTSGFLSFTHYFTPSSLRFYLCKCIFPDVLKYKKEFLLLHCSWLDGCNTFLPWGLRICFCSTTWCPPIQSEGACKSTTLLYGVWVWKCQN